MDPHGKICFAILFVLEFSFVICFDRSQKLPRKVGPHDRLLGHYGPLRSRAQGSKQRADILHLYSLFAPFAAETVLFCTILNLFAPSNVPFAGAGGQVSIFTQLGLGPSCPSHCCSSCYAPGSSAIFTFSPNHPKKGNFLRRQTEKKSPQVEGDELTGVCLLGAQTDASLLHQLVRSSLIIIDHYYIVNIFNDYNLSLVYQKYILSEEF